MKIRLRFEPRDLWIGIYWTNDRHSMYTRVDGRLHVTSYVDIYICLVPCFPIHLRFEKEMFS